jgi:hypothetical protein
MSFASDLDVLVASLRPAIESQAKYMVHEILGKSWPTMNGPEAIIAMTSRLAAVRVVDGILVDGLLASRDHADARALGSAIEEAASSIAVALKKDVQEFLKNKKGAAPP